MKKKLVLGGVLMSVLSFLSVGSVNAWGPERTLFTNDTPATYPVFNSITDNAAVGDERDFVRVVEVGTGATYSNEVKVSGGKEYQVYIYYHNDASSTFNTKEKEYVGVAREVKLSSQFSTEITKGSKGTISATISASNTKPAKVWDEAYMIATEDVKLAYKVASAKIFNDWGSNGSVLSTNLFADGTYLGLNELNGVILGCDEYSGQVVYTLVATKIEKDVPKEESAVPEEPEKPEEPVVPEEPEELPSTGPAEYILAGVIVIGLFGWGFYYVKSQKNLRRVQASVMGKSADENDKNISSGE